MTKAMIVTSGGKIHVTEIEADLATLQALVGGPIEFVYVEHGVHAYCNEEGKFRADLAPNLVATSMIPLLASHDIVMGDVVFLGEGLNGDEGNVPEHFISKYTEEKIA